MKIPKRFFWYWHDRHDIPSTIARFRDSWKAKHPDWQFFEFSEDNGIAVIPHEWLDLWVDPERHSPTSNVHQWRSNLLRLALVRNFGGVWIDADFECFKNVEPLIGEAEAFTSRENDTYVNNGFWGATANHPWVKEMCDQVLPRVLAHPERRSNMTTGPHLYTVTLHRGFWGVKVLPPEVVYPIPYTQVKRGGFRYDPIVDYSAQFPEAYAAHFWGNGLRKVQGFEWS